MNRSLAIDADFTLRHNDSNDEIRFAGRGDEIAVELPSAAAGLRLLKQIGLGRPHRLRSVTRILRYADLRVTVRTPRRRLLSIGVTPGSWLLRLIGVPHVKVHLFS